MPYERSRPPHKGAEGQFFHSHLQWRSVLKPSSAPFLGVIQDMYLNDIYKGRELFSEVLIQDAA
jgi:hypothetical protein